MQYFSNCYFNVFTWYCFFFFFLIFQLTYRCICDANVRDHDKMKNDNYYVNYTNVSFYVEYAYDLFANMYCDLSIKRKVFCKHNFNL